jgi:hypothetical protein
VTRRSTKNSAAPAKPDDPSRAHQPKFQKSSNASGLRGVYKHGAHGWRALICARGGKLIHLGQFSSKERAAEAFARAVERRKLEKQIRANAHTSDPERIAHDVVALINLSLANPRASIDEEARRRFEYAAKVIGGIGKSSNAEHAASDAAEIQLRGDVPMPPVLHAASK